LFRSVPDLLALVFAVLHANHELRITGGEMAHGTVHRGGNDLLLDLHITALVRPDPVGRGGGDAVVSEQVERHAAQLPPYRIAADDLPSGVHHGIQCRTDIGDVHLAGGEL